VVIEPGSLLLFTQEGCPPCRQLESMLHSETVSAFFKQTGASITEVNTRKHQDLVRKYRVSVTPTLVLLDNQAKERARNVGSMDATTFMSWVRSNRP
jgi:thioredoxin-related protein